MKFKIDENLPVEIAGLLQLAGHDARTVLDQRLGGEADRRVVTVCAQENRVLVTLDPGFANTLAYPPAEYPGFIVVRLARQDKAALLALFRRLIPLLKTEPLQGRLWIVDEDSVRIHGDELV